MLCNVCSNTAPGTVATTRTLALTARRPYPVLAAQIEAAPRRTTGAAVTDRPIGGWLTGVLTILTMAALTEADWTEIGAATGQMCDRAFVRTAARHVT